MIGELKNVQVDPTLFAEPFKNKARNTAGALSNPEISENRLKGAAKELEALFFYEMLKELRKTTQGGLLGKGLGNDVYNSLFDMELARKLADRGVGLKEMIMKQVKGRPEKGSGNLLNSADSSSPGTQNSLKTVPGDNSEIGRSDRQE
jgi:Rod binding domain-containing protein